MRILFPLVTVLLGRAVERSREYLNDFEEAKRIARAVLLLRVAIVVMVVVGTAEVLAVLTVRGWMSAASAGVSTPEPAMLWLFSCSGTLLLSLLLGGGCRLIHWVCRVLRFKSPERRGWMMGFIVAFLFGCGFVPLVFLHHRARKRQELMVYP